MTIAEVKQEKIALFDAQIQSYNYLVGGINNPFQYVGVQHNECVSFILNNVDSFKTKFVVNAGFDYAEKKMGVEKFHVDFHDAIYKSVDPILSVIENRREVTTDMLDLIKMNETVRGELYWMLDAILEFDATVDSFPEKINQLNEWEDRIKTSKYAYEDQQVLLIAGAVARYSTNYWINNGALVETHGTARKKKCLKAVFIVAADVLGAVGGAVAGTVAGGPVGGVVGGVVASGAMSAGAGLIFR